jgi:hypothetical protein
MGYWEVVEILGEKAWLHEVGHGDVPLKEMFVPSPFPLSLLLCFVATMM